MSTLSKALASAAGNAGAADAPNVADVFSTYLYDGNGGTQTITNGIDLAGEGGLVWMKVRNNIFSRHELVDTERGSGKSLETSDTTAERGFSGLSSFNSDGFTLNNASGQVNSSGDNQYVSWTFRKAPRFFDIVEYSGDGSTSHVISHNLGVAPGFIMIKKLNTATNWVCYHRSMVDPENQYLPMTNSEFQSFNNLITVDADNITLGVSHSLVNASGSTYVAYIFAHDPYGENDDGMISCSHYISNESSSLQVNLPWEPQYLMVKFVTGGANPTNSDWMIFDSMRGVTADYPDNAFDDHPLKANSYAAESSQNFLELNSKGFRLTNGFTTGINGGPGLRFVYMAIRAPMMVEPEAGTEVFVVDTKGSTGDGKSPAFRSGFPVDMAINRISLSGAQSNHTGTRLTKGKYLVTNTTASENADTDLAYDYMNGYDTRTSSDSNNMSWMFKRAKGFFDVVAFDGVSGGSVVTHSLGVIPELVLIKARNTTGDWYVIHSDVTKELYLNYDVAAGTVTGAALSSTTFTLRTGLSNPSNSYIAYLFATLDGVSKVGSYTGNGGTGLDISCGFSAGARFVLIKRTDSTGDWYIWDSTRGIESGNDPHLSLNSTAAEVTSDDSIDPESAGFTVNQVSATNINVSSATYIFLAIA